MEPEPEEQVAEVPDPVPAPLMVVEQDGFLRVAPPGDGLDAPGRRLARQGWTALRDYLTDLADLRLRLDNQMPTLSRAMARFDHAMGTEYDQANPIGMGVHGTRIIALAGAADETMSEADATELRSFAAAVGLFLERFPDWRAYRDASAPPVDPVKLAESLPRIEEIADALFDHVEIERAIPTRLKEQVGAVRDAPDHALSVRGMYDSTLNVLSALGARALRLAKDFVGQVAAGVKKRAAAELASRVLGATKGALLWLAESYPEKFGWIKQLLSTLGL